MIMSNAKKMTYEAIAIKGDVAYASDYERNGLFKVNMSTGECEFIRLFDDEAVNKSRIHCSAIWIGTQIYFVPASGNRITIYNPEDNSMVSVEIPLPKLKQYSFYRAQFKFIRAIKREDNLWLVPCSYPGVVKFNLLNYSVQVFDEWIENDDYFFRIGVGVESEKIIAANGKNNAVLIFDMEKESGEIVRIGAKNNGVMHVCKIKDEYWFAPRLPGTITVWNIGNNQITEYDKYPEGFESGNPVFCTVYNFLDKVFFVPLKSNYGLVFDNGHLRLNNDLRDKYGQGMIEYLFETDTERFFRKVENRNNYKYFKISKMDNKVEEYAFVYYDNGERDRCMIGLMSAQRVIVKENISVGLKALINGLR